MTGREEHPKWSNVDIFKPTRHSLRLLQSINDFETLAFEGAFDFKILDRSPIADTLVQRDRPVGIFAVLRQVPVGDGGVESGLFVGVILLETALERVVERDIVGDLPAVYRDVPFAVAIVVRLVMKCVLEKIRTRPRITEVILRAGAKGAAAGGDDAIM